MSLTSLKSLSYDLTRPQRGTVSNLIRASVKVHRSVVAVSVGSKSSVSSARNLLTNWTWIVRVPILFGVNNSSFLCEM